MDPMKLHFDVRDIFRAPRLALSGKKILVFVQALFVGYADYLILTYLSFALAGYSFSETWSQYGLYPCLSGNPAPWYVCQVIPLHGMHVSFTELELFVYYWQSISDVLLSLGLPLNN